MASGKRKRKKRSEAKPFWKKIKNPELKRIAEHIGKITDNSSWKDILDVVLALTCGAAGWIAGENLGIKDLKIKAGMALSGAIAYRLATSGNLIAGASGTALLGAYGLIDVWNPLYQGIKQTPIIGEPIKEWEQFQQIVSGETPTEITFRQRLTWQRFQLLKHIGIFP